MRTLELADALAGPDFEPIGPCEVEMQGGRIAKIRAHPGPITGRRLLAMPAPINAHDHARPLSAVTFGGAGKPLETWLLSLAVMPPVDPYLAAAAALGRAARGGAAGELVHLVRPMGLTSLPDEAKHVARAADDVGIHLGLAIGLKDQNPLVYGDHAPTIAAIDDPKARELAARMFDTPMPGPRSQVAAVDAVAAALRDTRVDVQYGPAGPQWCSRPLLEAIAEASERSGRRVHMHLLETRLQRTWADQAFPEGIVRYLADIGLLSERLTLAHCVWVRPDELEMIAAAGATIVANASSNLVLRSGVAPVGEMLRQGVRIAIGVDGAAVDDDDDALRETRLAHHLHAGVSFERALTAQQCLLAAAVNGRRTIGAIEGGVLAEGMPADLLVLDLDALDRDRVMPVCARALVLARARKEMIVELLVSGRTVVKEGATTGVDLPAIEDELRTAYRAARPEFSPFAAAWPKIEPAVAAFYQDVCGCS